MSRRSTPCNCASCERAGIAISNAKDRILARRMRRTPREDFGFAILQTSAPAECKPPIVSDHARRFKLRGSSSFGKGECDRRGAAASQLLFRFFGEFRFKIVGAGHQFA